MFQFFVDSLVLLDQVVKTLLKYKNENNSTRQYDAILITGNY